jgi:hypothetical protein
MLKQMHDIDNQISRIVGEQGYMKQLEKITGDIFSVDKEVYVRNLDKIKKCQANIRIALDNIYKDTTKIQRVRDEFYSLIVDFSDEKIFIVKEKKLSKKGKKIKDKQASKSTESAKPAKPDAPKLKINQDYKPTSLYALPWFKNIKRIEKTVNNGLKKLFPDVQLESDVDKKSYNDVKDIFKSHPELIDIYEILDVQLTSEVIYNSFKFIKKFANIIVNTVLNPWYDVKRKISSNEAFINKVFKDKTALIDNATTDDIINILTNFMIAKYRSTVTGNNKHFVKIFMDVVGSGTLSTIDGGRFLEIVEAIDLEQLHDKDSAYKFATTAKAIMEQVAKGETVTPEVMKKIDELFVTKPTKVESKEEIVTDAPIDDPLN